MTQIQRCKLHKRFYLLFLVVFFVAVMGWASVGGSISGTVQDPSDSVVPNASVTVREVNTGLKSVTHTDGKGHYTLPVLQVGRYEMNVEAAGFRAYQRKDILLDTDAALTLDVRLVVGSETEIVSVSDDTLHVETVSTQLGEVITGRQMTAVPLNGRSFTDLLSLQPGRCAGYLDHRDDRAGRGSNGAFAFGHAQPWHHLGEWAAGICQLL